MPEKLKEGARAKQEKSSLKLAVRSITSSPAFNVAALILLLLCVFGGLRFLSARQTRGQIKFVENSRFETSEGEGEENLAYMPPEIFKGEVYETSIRLRETGSLGMAISLAVFASLWSHFWVLEKLVVTTVV